MKKFAIFLALSLAANVALVATFLVHHVVTGTGDAAVTTTASATRPTRLSAGELAALASTDLAGLKAAGVPDDVARDLLVGRAYTRQLARQRELNNARNAKTPYWRNPGPLSKEQRNELRRIQREFADTLAAATGESPGGGDPRDTFLPGAKRDQLRRIADDYDEMRNAVYLDISGIQLPSDQEKLRLLRQEQERDIAAALSPEELAEYNLHYSNTAAMVRGRFGDGIQSEEDFKKLVALQKTFNDQFSPPDGLPPGQQSPVFFAARADAEAKLVDDMHAALGDDGFAALAHGSDPDYKMATSLATRLNLPGGTADAVLATRDSYAALSQQINQDASLSPQDRRTQLQALADKAGADLQNILGAEGATVYDQQANWVNMLKGGGAFSTNPKDRPKGYSPFPFTTFPVPPPRPAAPKG